MFGTGGTKTFEYRKRLKIFKNSTGTLTYDPALCEARSYRWWVFVKKIRGVVVFNDYSYSVSTSAHQSAVYGLIRKQFGESNIVTVAIHGGLQLFESEALPPLYETAAELTLKLKRKGLKAETKDRAAAALERVREQIKTCRALGAKCSRAQIAKISERVATRDAERLDRARVARAAHREATASLKATVATLSQTVDLPAIGF